MPDVCLVVPCFNEAARLNGAAFLDHLARDARTSLCFVNDGSTDGTSQALSAIAAQQPERIFVRTLTQNSGKAEAVRQGMLHVASMKAFAYIGYWDADLATPLAELDAMLDTLDQRPSCQIVLGSRWQRLGSRIRRRAWRHALGRVFATVASLTLDLPVYDSQCGAKVMRAAVVDALFAEPFMTRWMFDLELLARLQRRGSGAGHDAAVEVPLTQWEDVRGSRLGLLQMAATPIGFWKIRRRYRPR
jgi:dolichyl-phosphate beta-glucosyltransferase